MNGVVCITLPILYSGFPTHDGPTGGMGLGFVPDLRGITDDIREDSRKRKVNCRGHSPGADRLS